MQEYVYYLCICTAAFVLGCGVMYTIDLYRDTNNKAITKSVHTKTSGHVQYSLKSTLNENMDMNTTKPATNI